MARLIERTREGEAAHELLFGSTTIGRGRLNDIVIPDPGERRLHATVVSAGGGRYLVRDHRSRGGVMVNGERVRELGELPDRAELRVGPVAFTFEASTDESGATPQPAASLGRGVMRLTLGTLVSRVCGYVREMVALAFFGCRGPLDAYVAATTLPNLFRDVLGEYAAENAFMPAFKTLLSRGHEGAARRLLAVVLRFAIVASAALAILGILFAPWAMAAVVPGFARRQPELVSLATELTRCMMPNMLIIAVAAVFGSLLLAQRRFLLYSLSPAGMSVVAIAATVGLTRQLDVGSLALGVVLGELVHMGLVSLPVLWRRQGRALVGAASSPPRGQDAGASARAAIRKVGRSAVPIGCAALLTKVTVVADQVLCSLFCGPGRISALYGAARLLQLPFGILGLAVGRAAFPTLIEQASSEGGKGFSREVVRALRLNTFLMLPAALALTLLARPCVRLMFERREFTPEHTGWVALALALYAVGLVAMGARTVLSRAFFALLDTRTPLVLSAVEVVLNVGLSIAFVLTPLEHGGLALGTALATWVQVTLLLVVLRRELGRQGRRLSLDGLGAGLGRMALCGVAMAAAIVGSSAAVERLWAGSSLLARLAALGVPGCAGLLAYLAAAWLLRCEEVGLLHRRRATPVP